MELEPILIHNPRPRLNRKPVFPGNNSKNKTAVRPSYLYDGNSYTGKIYPGPVSYHTSQRYYVLGTIYGNLLQLYELG